MSIEKDLIKLISPFISTEISYAQWFILQYVEQNIHFEFVSNSGRKKISLSPVYRYNDDDSPMDFLTIKQVEKIYCRANRIMSLFGLTRVAIRRYPTTISLHLLDCNLKVGLNIYQINIGETSGFQFNDSFCESVSTIEKSNTISDMIQNILTKYEISIEDHPIVISRGKIHCVSCGKSFFECKDGYLDITAELLTQTNVDNLLVFQNKDVTSLVPLNYPNKTSDETLTKEEIEQHNDHKEENNLKSLIVDYLRVNGKSTNREISSAIGIVGQTALRYVLQLVETGMVLVDKTCTPNKYMLSIKDFSQDAEVEQEKDYCEENLKDNILSYLRVEGRSTYIDVANTINVPEQKVLDTLLLMVHDDSVVIDTSGVPSIFYAKKG